MEDLPSPDWINYYPEFVVTSHRRTVHQDPYASQIDRDEMVDGWFVPSMPDLNQRNPYLSNYLIQNSIWWIEYAGLAGIRMDTYPYPMKEMTAEWNRRILAEYPDFNIVGEEWSHNPAIVSYWQWGQTNRDGYQGNCPSLMDFPLQNAARESLLAADKPRHSGWIMLYETLANDFLYPEPGNLVIFPDNHDMPRFYVQLGRNQDLYRLGIILFLTTRGIPQIYYGSEILMDHPEDGGHGSIRKDFPGGWEGDRINAFTGEGLRGDEKNMQEFFRTLLNWRKNTPLTHTGELIHFVPKGSTYVYGRYNEENALMVILNKGDEPVTLEMERYRELTGGYETGIDVLSGETFDLQNELEVPALRGLILEME
jgi:glycosidase